LRGGSALLVLESLLRFCSSQVETLRVADPWDSTDPLDDSLNDPLNTRRIKEHDPCACIQKFDKLHLA
jgi:hypothetical protein